MFWAGLIIGMPIGALFGILTIAICSAGRKNDE